MAILRHGNRAVSAVLNIRGHQLADITKTGQKQRMILDLITSRSSLNPVMPAGAGMLESKACTTSAVTTLQDVTLRGSLRLKSTGLFLVR
jgi:hypothetical protein